VKIRILTPVDDSIAQQAQELGKYVDIRYIPEELQTQITVFIVDRKSSIVAELKDDTKVSVYEAIGLGTYSNSASTVSSYVSIFETLWRQSGMYEKSQNQLHSAEEELDDMKDYLNEVLKEIASIKKPNI
jgi:two-component system sensor histidine kinase VicK